MKMGFRIVWEEMYRRVRSRLGHGLVFTRGSALLARCAKSPKRGLSDLGTGNRTVVALFYFNFRNQVALTPIINFQLISGKDWFVHGVEQDYRGTRQLNPFSIMLDLHLLRSFGA
jgi:hypothetical protein